ncbi:MAG: CDP-diacylglycerol--glycerol-3-phosphate 3-phosphatidyltransferase [Candidatus Cloacimonetes bacterium]|nr:CDP-diacylglycerol--glycerol-3-phosphate 3-phosphatidyltransferase [Candidatus Cloacimonadota bacterium]
MIRHVPNLLTIIRILLTPVFIWTIFFWNNELAAVYSLLIFCVASISDYFDGMIARKFQVISDFGKIMDPLADKILVVSALLALTLKLHYISLIVVLIIIIREVAVTILREVYAKKKIIIAANIWGKVKTVLQMIGIIAALLLNSVSGLLNQHLINHFKTGIYFFFWIIAVVTILSGVNYFIIKKRK